LKEHQGKPLLQCYQELSRKFPQGLADVPLLAEEISGKVSGVAEVVAAMEKEIVKPSRL
jgi:hypothetical protein